MRFRVVDKPKVPKRNFPVVYLVPDPWDDFGLKTLFRVTYWPSADNSIDLGSVKIFQRGQPRGRTPLQEQFKNLADDYCSLGQDISYYEQLRKLPYKQYDSYLSCLRDVVYSPILLTLFQDEDGFKNSLLRSGAAESALSISPALFSDVPRSPSTELRRLHFRTNVGGSRFIFSLDAEDDSQLPGRITAVIGYNGVGKTRLLANLAMVAATGTATRQRTNLAERYGEFINADKPVSFGSVIAVSYSAFDTFDVPGTTTKEKRRISKETGLLGYSYCGLRDLYALHSSGATRSKSAADLANDFRDAIDRIQELERKSEFMRIVAPLALEASFQRIGVLHRLDQDPDKWEKEFVGLSSGHKIVLSIAAHLAAYLQKRSLVLVDEPEAHLHPPLLAALLKSIRIALREHDSHAVVATHSPVVLQETPSKFVRIVRRLGKSTSIVTPATETFGENIGLLTRDVFNLSTSGNDFYEVLNRLSSRFTLTEIEELFGRPLSFQVRAYIQSIQYPGANEHQ